MPDVGWEIDGRGECCLGFDCLERTLGMKSDIRDPAAEGGRRARLPIGEASREVPEEGDALPPCVTLGNCSASGDALFW